MDAAHFQARVFEARAALFSAVAAELALAMNAPADINIALAGGSTPQDVYKLLQKQNPPWDKVRFCPTDERCTDDSPRRNDEMLRRCLGSRAQIIPLQEGAAPPPLHTALLGMGEDGHIASLFPQAEQDAEQGAAQERGDIFRVAPAAAPEPRLTLPLSSFVQAENLLLLFCGDKKWAALATPGLPVTALLRQRSHIGALTQIFYAP